MKNQTTDLPAQQRERSIESKLGTITVTEYRVDGETEWIDEFTYKRRALLAKLHAHPQHPQQQPAER